MNAPRPIEIRTHRLKPASGAAFHAPVPGQRVPVMRFAQMDVVACGQALNDVDDSCLVRAGTNLQLFTSSQEESCASAAGRHGLREAIVGLIRIDTYETMWLAAEAVETLRDGHAGQQRVAGTTRAHRRLRSGTA